MHVFSSMQFRSLINYNDDGYILNSLLDIGAGDGSTTMNMKEFFNQVFVTEMAPPMKKQLVQKGFT